MDWSAQFVLVRTRRTSSFTKRKFEQMISTNRCSLTNNKDVRMKVEVIDQDDVYHRANYEHFRITDDESYTLEIGNYSSDPNYKLLDGLLRHNGAKFTTKDMDNDEDPHVNCAVEMSGPGWYHLIPMYDVFSIFVIDSNLGTKIASRPTFLVPISRRKRPHLGRACSGILFTDTANL